MKHNFLPLSLLGVLLLPSCANYDDINFYLEITTSKDSSYFYNKDTINVELYDNSTIKFNIPKSIKVNENNSNNLLSFNYDESKINLTFDHNTSTNKIFYSFQTKELFENENLIIKFDNNEYNFKINSLKPTGYNKLDIATLSTYKEFKEMIDSISYYTYQDNYPGISSYSSSTYWGNSFHYDFKDDNYSSDYLKYLKDDCYYPSKFDFAYPNLMYKEIEMRFDDKCSVEKDSKKHTMLGYNVLIGVIDPGCTNPTNPLRSMSFEAIPLNYVSKHEYSNEFNNKKLNNHYYLLSKEYSDIFLDYKVNDINIKLISPTDNNVLGFFEDSTYLYTLSCYYER